MVQQWSRYVLRIDALLEEALLHCVRNSLNAMYTVLHGDGTTGPQPLLKMTATLKDNKVKLNNNNYIFLHVYVSRSI